MECTGWNIEKSTLWYVQRPWYRNSNRVGTAYRHCKQAPTGTSRKLKWICSFFFAEVNVSNSSGKPLQREDLLFEPRGSNMGEPLLCTRESSLTSITYLDENDLFWKRQCACLRRTLFVDSWRHTVATMRSINGRFHNPAAINQFVLHGNAIVNCAKSVNCKRASRDSV